MDKYIKYQLRVSAAISHGKGLDSIGGLIGLKRKSKFFLFLEADSTYRERIFKRLEEQV